MKNVITRLRDAGFHVRLADEKIGIAPFDKLTETQRSWISEHRDVVLSELLDEASNEAANVDIELSVDRWQKFLDMSVIHDVAAAEVEAEFTDQDITDLLEEPDDKLPLHAKTIANAVKRKRPVVSNRPKIELPATIKAAVTCCGACKHFDRIDHPHLGHCAAGEPEGVCGNWDSDPRSHCEQFQAVAS